MKNIIVLLVLLVGLSGNAQHDVTTFHFTENIGQLDSKVKYHSKIHVGDVYLEKNKFVFDMFSGDELDAYYKLKHDNENRKSISDNSRTTESELLKPFNKHAYSMTFVGANQNPSISPSDKIEGYKNYFIGDDESKWVSGVKSFRTIEYGDLYDNIDMEIYTVFERMKYDFTVNPGGNPKDISVKYDNVESIEIVEGALIIHLSTGAVKEMKPIAYQTIEGKRINVPCQFMLNGNTLSFKLPDSYDNSEKLIIDPTWIFSTLTGSASDNWGFTATYDTTGALYSGGIAFGNSYPTVGGSYQTAFAGGNVDIVISKFSPNGTTLLFSTYLGGTNNEMPHSLVNDSQNNLVLLASTGSSNFPTTVGVYNTSFNAGINVTYSNGVQYSGGCDIAIVKFNSTGSALLASTFVGGSDNDGANESFVYNYADEVRGEIVVDASDDIYVTTSTWSTDFPTTGGSYSQSSFGSQDAVAIRMSSDLTTMIWGTYLGGSARDGGYSIRVAPNGDTYLCGGTESTNLATTAGVIGAIYQGGIADGYIARLNNANGALLDLSYIGTNGYDQAFILEVDGAGDVFATGQSTGGYPVANAIYSNAGGTQFIHKMAPDFSITIYSTVFGSGAGSDIDISLTAFLVDNCGNVYVSGWGGNSNNEGSTDNMPISGDAQQPSTDGSDFYFFVMERDAQQLLYGSYFGSASANEHVDGGTSRFDKAGNVYQAVCAGCGGNSFPTTPGVYSTTNGSSNCNLGAIKFGFDFQGVEASANVPPNITLCSNDYTVDFTSGGSAPQHEWDFGDGAAASFSANPTHTYDEVGNYVVRYIAFDPNSCNLRDTIYFDVELIQAPAFNASFTLPDIPPCSDPTVVYVDAEITGTGIDSTQWNMGDGIIYTDDLVISHEYLTEGIYPIEVIAWDLTCNISDTIRDTLNFITTLSTATANAPADTTLCSNPPFAIPFTSDGLTPYVSWDFGDGNTSTAQNPTNTFETAGTYTVQFIAIDSNTCNIADTVPFTVELIQAPNFNASFNIPVIPPCSDPTVVYVDAEIAGTGIDSTQWNMGDGIIYTDDLVISHEYLTEGIYPIEVIAWDLTCNISDTIRDTLNFITTLSTATANAPADTTLCSNPPFAIPFTSDGLTPYVSWDFGDGNTSTAQNPTNTFLTAGTYTVQFIAIDSNTCNIADTVPFTVELIQAPTFNASFTLPDIPPCSDPTVVYVDAEIAGTGIDSTQWNMGDGIIYTDDLVISHEYLTEGIYPIEVIAWNLQCDVSDTIRDTLYFNLTNITATATAPSDTVLCSTPPFDISFSSDGNTPQVYWDFGDGNTSANPNPTNTFADTGSYEVMFVAIDPNSCNGADTTYFNVDLIQAPTFSADFDLPIIPPCSDPSSVAVNINILGTGIDSTHWDMGDGTTFEDSIAISYNYTNTGIYDIILTAWDYCGGDTSIYETFNFITDSSLAVASAPEDTALCTLPPFSIDFASSGTSSAQFWDFGDGNTSTDVNPTNTFLESGTYVVTYIAIDSSTCNIADTASFIVNLIQAEEFSAEINFTPPPPCGGDSMLVELAFSGTAVDSLIWDMGNGDVFYADSVAYYYTEAGIYNLSLTAFDFTCALTEVISSEVPFFGNISTDIIIPNVFTPNNDGENDLLTFVNVSGSETFRLTIWNRWGKKVFVTDDPLNHWDGTNKNDNSIHEGVYYYEILFTDKCSDKQQLKTGFVHLMR